jgi:hypothetical protein
MYSTPRSVTISSGCAGFASIFRRSRRIQWPTKYAHYVAMHPDNAAHAKFLAENHFPADYEIVR